MTTGNDGARADVGLTWDTTCVNCARTLEAAHAETERAEQAEGERDSLLRTEKASAAFHKVTVKERDCERHMRDKAEAALAEARQRIAAGLALADEWYPGTPGPRRMNSWGQLAKEQCARKLRKALGGDDA